LKRALLSVSDKTGLEEFARVLTRRGIELVASGGTARALSAAGLAVVPVESVTGLPEMIGGRVKTLHPAIHAGILARRTPEHLAELAAQNISPIDLVVVNLYPFQATVARAETTVDEAIEQIDIGGVALLRAAAKNFESVTVVCDPADYRAVADEIERAGATTRETRARLALKAFSHTAAYDAAIAQYLARQTGDDQFPSRLNLSLDKAQDLRYGENPHQRAALYSFTPGTGPLGGEILQGKELSYNNLLDLDAAWRAAVSYDAPTICIVKHLSPCGIASAPQLADAFRYALESDPVSAFGGVIASNRAFGGETATALGELFVECIAAPGFSDDARAALAKKKNCRLLSMPDLAVEPRFELRSITRGVLRQDVDAGDPAETAWSVVTRRAPTDAEMQALRFAWRAVAHAKSNAIVFARGTATVGIGGGQPNRVDSVRIAATRAGGKSKGAVMASDAFFPFPDSVQVAADAGITAIVAPGGSVRDVDAIAEADARGIAMVFTGVRHFRH
jgi:phosphoribosylaminoimidazolecarboxamide formyltransferase / IMP cyclohydrolase